MQTIDLNADMGEYADERQATVEADLMAFLTSCSVACGGHAGDAATMLRTVRLAKAHSVSVGAHPAYPDREGFGRRPMDISHAALLQSLRSQIDDLKDVLLCEHAPLAHVKAHGALYNAAAKDDDLADIVAEACADAILVGPPNSALARAAARAGKPFAAEGFVDRLYRADGSLTPRNEPGAVIESIAARAAQAQAIALKRPIETSGGALALTADTLCIHSDSDGAVETANAVRDALAEASVAVAAFTRKPQ